MIVYIDEDIWVIKWYRLVARHDIDCQLIGVIGLTVETCLKIFIISLDLTK